MTPDTMAARRPKAALMTAARRATAMAALAAA
ncbi:MAG: hypothetical protein QOG38_104, partial [Hyphomicrobiales bacterium]|nr:hypothetical protein [Hyphomicrobiales bacterium]